MTERLLQYIWQFQYFNARKLLTTDDELLQVINPGIYNTNQGPDFSDAKIQIGETLWAGSIELHINSSHWKQHKHSGDENYKNVILHVVWKDDINLGLLFPTLVLQDKVSKLLLNKYEELMKKGSFIPCEKSINKIDEITWVAWKERLLIERLEAKTTHIKGLLKQNTYHWEETFWWLLAKNFGVKVNSEAFEMIAQSIPMNVLIRHKNQIHQIEALLFGQAGLLDEEVTGEYPKILQREYKYLTQKHDLKKPHIKLVFLRMRPANFPTVRLAQLAVLANEKQYLFATILDKVRLGAIQELLSISAYRYWNYHYLLDEASPSKKKVLGKQMINNILINTVVPILFAYGLYRKNNEDMEKALRWLHEIAPEKNAITRGFAALQFENKNAADSQAFIHLKNEYCNKKRCLDCAIGNKLLKEN